MAIGDLPKTLPKAGGGEARATPRPTRRRRRLLVEARRGARRSSRSPWAWGGGGSGGPSDASHGRCVGRRLRRSALERPRRSLSLRAVRAVKRRSPAHAMRDETSRERRMGRAAMGRRAERATREGSHAARCDRAASRGPLAVAAVRRCGLSVRRAASARGVEHTRGASAMRFEQRLAAFRGGPAWRLSSSCACRRRRCRRRRRRITRVNDNVALLSYADALGR
jgi:hypothetical protein